MKISTSTVSGLCLDFLVASVISISIVAIVLLVLNVFSPKTAVFAGMAISIPILSFASRRLGGIANVNGVGLATIATVVLVALVFRADPYPWINGGQDQGVYVSMSSYYQHGGNIFIEDKVLPRLTDNELKKAYTENRGKGVFYPGVYYGGKKDYVFQFYHLHPLWMAVFADFLGDDARGYALTFFGILSIVFLCLLTFELSGSRLASLCVGLLIAINPLHVFFSKWPVTEVVALAYSSMGFYYLARAYRLSASALAARWSLLIACLSLSLLFFVRISGFLYLPLLAIIFMIGSWQLKAKKDSFGADLMVFSLGCITLYVASVFYGLKYSPNYSVDIYQLTFGKIADGQWGLIITTGLLSMLALMYAWFRLLGNSAFVSRVSVLAQPKVVISGMLFFITVAAGLSLFKVYQLGFSDAYSNHPWLGIQWKLSGSGAQAVARSSVINWLIYASPVLAVLGGIAMLRRKLDFRLALVMVLVGVPLGVFVISNPVLPYQYYYARYLLTESVPYAIVACVVAMFSGDSLNWRRMGVVAVILTVPLFGFFTFKQLGAEEGVRPLSVLRTIAAHVEEGDVLLIEPTGWSIPRAVLETPLSFYFGLKTFVLPASEREAVRKKLAKSFRNVWLLTPNPIDDDRFVLEERLLHYDKVVERVGHIPTKIIEDFWRQELFLYAMKKPDYPSSRGESYKLELGRHEVWPDSDETRSILGDGWHALESAHVWSTEIAKINLKNTMFVNNKLPNLMKLEITPYAASKERPVKVEVHVGGRRLEFVYMDSARNTIEIPIACQPNEEQCRIEFLVENANSPEILGRSSDARVLGFALYSFSFE